MSRTSNRLRTNPPPDGSADSRTREPRSPHPDQAADLEIIQQLLALALEAISRKTPDVRLADVLKLLEFKQRLQPQSDAQEIFWQWIERFRQENAAGRADEEAPESPGKPEENNT